jgi:hypothetical protein
MAGSQALLLTTGLFVAVIVAVVWSIIGPPRHFCGLQRGARYRITKSFASGKVNFREGEVVRFKRQRRYRPWVVPDPWHEDADTRERDLYHFTEEESNLPKTISSEDVPKIEDWVKFLEKLDD